MSFIQAFETLPFTELEQTSLATRTEEVRAILDRPRDSLGLTEFARLISPAATAHIEALARRSQALTRQRFGRAVRLFAPLYLSNECINNCAYCGFSRDNPILRVSLEVSEVRREAEALCTQGFRNLLLVAGEHPRFVSEGFLADCVMAVRAVVPAVSLEVGPMETPDYSTLVRSGAEGLVVYQETYDRAAYSRVHTAGPKKDFAWRLATPERAYEAGFRRLGIGALFGLSEWRREALAVAAHAAWLLRNCWKAHVTVSLPRLRPCAGEFQPLTTMREIDLVQLVCALRLFLPDVGLVLSTREAASLRDGLVPLGITLMSAGSHTEPGGYTGAGRSNVHYTKRGRVQTAGPLPDEAPAGRLTSATGQFEIADERSPQEVASMLTRLGLDPVWKDWDTALGIDPAVGVSQ